MARTSSTRVTLRVTLQVMASVLSPSPVKVVRVLVPVAPRLTQVTVTIERTNWTRTPQRSTDAWAASPAPARVGSHILRFGCGHQGERDKGRW